MKTVIFTLAILLGSAFQISAQLDAHKGDLIHLDNTPTIKLDEESFDRNNIISFFPNPAVNQITLSNHSDRFDIIQIIDFTGTVVKEIPFGMTPLDISDLRSGSYIIAFYKKGQVVRQRLEKK